MMLQREDDFADPASKEAEDFRRRYRVPCILLIAKEASGWMQRGADILVSHST